MVMVVVVGVVLAKGQQKPEGMRPKAQIQGAQQGKTNAVTFAEEREVGQPLDRYQLVKL